MRLHALGLSAVLLGSLTLANCGTIATGDTAITPPASTDGGNVPPPVASADAGPAPSADAGTGLGGPTGPTGPGLGGGGTTDAGTGGSGVDVDAGTVTSAADAGAPAGVDAGVSVVPVRLTQGEGATALAVDATTIYWINQVLPGAPGQMAVRSLSKTGGFVQTIAAGDGSEVRGMVADKGDLYWTMLQCARPCDYPGAGSDRFVFHATASRTGFTRVGAGWSQLVLDETRVFARAPMFGWVLSFPRAGGDGLILARDAGIGTSLTTDGQQQLFWAQPGNGTNAILLRVIGKNGTGEGVVLGAAPAALPVSTILAGDFFFFRDTDGNVGRISRPHPGQPEILWKAPNGLDLEVKGARIYWNQSQTNLFPGCLGVSNFDGTDGHCIDQGAHQYGPVRGDDTDLYFIRDGDIYRVPRQ